MMFSMRWNGTLSRHQTLDSAIKSAKKLSKNGIRLAIFENNGDPSEQKLVKWVFPRRRTCYENISTNYKYLDDNSRERFLWCSC